MLANQGFPSCCPAHDQRQSSVQKSAAPFSLESRSSASSYALVLPRPGTEAWGG